MFILDTYFKIKLKEIFIMQEIKHCQSLDELLKNCPKNEVILNSLIKSWSKINSPLYNKIFCSVSGGTVI